MNRSLILVIPGDVRSHADGSCCRPSALLGARALGAAAGGGRTGVRNEPQTEHRKGGLHSKRAECAHTGSLLGGGGLGARAAERAADRISLKQSASDRIG
jgi:hypothetical protein